MEINKCNAAGKPYGYWEVYLDGEKKYLKYKCHYFNGELIGYDEDIKYKVHRLNNSVIGCILYRLCNLQYFNKTPDNKFGEMIAWK